MRAFLPIALLLLAACASPARAMTGEELLALCKEDAVRCNAYLDGLQDAGHAEMIYLRSGCSTSKCRVDTSDLGRGEISGHAWCLPEDLSGQARAAPVLDLLEGDAYARFSQAVPSVAQAWAQAWPCAD